METTKKISLRSLKEKMSDNSLKQIMAGYGDGGCDTVEPAVGTCGWGKIDFYDIFGRPGGEITCGISKAYAQYLHCVSGGNWCCDSCNTTWYCS